MKFPVPDPIGHHEYERNLHHLKTELDAWLYPHTPVRVEYENEYRYELYVAGEWVGHFRLEHLVNEVQARVNDNVVQWIDQLTHPEIQHEYKDNPDWAGWQKISPVYLTELVGGLDG